MKQPYDHLASFLASWFHQDFDIAGNSVEEIVGAFKKTASTKQISEIRADIDRFLADHGDAAEAAFERNFDLDVEPTGFAPSAVLFLRAIDTSLGSAVA
jgi:CdiI immunity protein